MEDLPFQGTSRTLYSQNISTTPPTKKKEEEEEKKIEKPQRTSSLPLTTRAKLTLLPLLLLLHRLSLRRLPTATTAKQHAAQPMSNRAPHCDRAGRSSHLGDHSRLTRG